MDRLQDAEHDIGGLPGLGLSRGDPVGPARQCLPQEGRAWSEIRAELLARKDEDYDWRAGRLPIYVYHESDELLTVSREAYGLYFSENALGMRAFPSLARMEHELIEMSLGLFEAPAEADGSFTSGGTESIFLALKTARDRFRVRNGSNVRPRVVVPGTAHPAFDKAAHYLDVDIIRTPVGPDFRCDLAQLRAATDDRTMLIAGSAPCYPFGVFDPIEELGEFALSRGLWLHVDACLGGFLAPFARDEGYPIPPFDFAVAGVSSLSADLHKYGFSAKGASVLLYRSASSKALQRFHFSDWPRGTYSTETFLGTRPGGAIASAWAVMQYLGRSGYQRLARKAMDAKLRLIRGIERIGGLQVIFPSELSIVLFTSVDPKVDINAVAEHLEGRGWFVGRSRQPLALHLALNAVHAPVVREYLVHLQDAVQQVRKLGSIGAHDDRTY